MTYSVKYKMRGQWYYRKIRRVKGDFIPSDLIGMRVLILDDESRVEIPIQGTMFMFSKERFVVVKNQMEREAGQKMAIT